MSTSSSSLAGRLNEFRNGVLRFTLDLNAEREGLPALLTLAGDGSAEHAKLIERRAQLKETNGVLNEVNRLFNQARTAALDNNIEEAERLFTEARRRLADAQRLFGNNTPTTPPAPSPAPAPVPAPPAAPDNGNGGDNSPAPVKGKDDKGAKPAPAPAPAPAPTPVQTDDKAPAWATALQDSVRGALEQNAETIRVHVEGCNTTLEEFRKALDELAKGTLKPELADILNTFGAQELSDFLAGNGGGGNVNTDALRQQIDEIGGRINADDLAFLHDLRAAMEHEELTLADLIAAAKLGHGVNGAVGFFDARRWVPGSRKNPSSHA